MPERWDEFKVSSTERQVVRALGSIGSATLVSRVVGFVRDIVVALVFGAGPVTDAFFVAFRIPNILRRLLAEGALSTAMIPVFSEYFVTQSRPEVLRMLRAVLALALVALGVTALLGIATAPWLVTAIAPGIAEDPARGGLAVLLTRVMFPYVVLVGLAALAAGALNAQGRFFASALGPAVQNVGMILAISLLASRVDPPILSLATAVPLGAIAQLPVQLPSLRRSGRPGGPRAPCRRGPIGGGEFGARRAGRHRRRARVVRDRSRRLRGFAHHRAGVLRARRGGHRGSPRHRRRRRQRARRARHDGAARSRGPRRRIVRRRLRQPRDRKSVV